MALQVPSGLIVSASGPLGAEIQTVQPMMIVGFGSAPTSGYHQITDFSGALNVNISGGSVTAVTSISGNIVLVVSGGAIQVSGTVRSLISGDAVSTSNSGNVVLVASGGTIQISGTVRALVSGDAVTVTGGVQVSGTVGVSGQVIVTSGGTLPENPVSGVAIYGYQWKLVSGVGVTNIQSGASLLHAVAINAWASGGQVEVWDALSGTGSGIFATIDFVEVGSLSANAFAPQVLIYDAYMKSGIVVSLSGAAINITVLYKNPV